MGPTNAELTPLKLSTRDLPERDRLPWWREAIGQKLLHVDIEPLCGGPYHGNATVLTWPGVRAIWTGVSTPRCWTRSCSMLGDGDDSFTLIVGGDLVTTIKQRSKEVPVTMGDAVGILNAEPARVALPESGTTASAFIVPRDALTPFVRDIDEKAMRLIPRDNQGLRLLVKYFSNLREEPHEMNAEMRRLVVNHVYDLIVLAVGATSDGAAMANRRGVRAARLEAIKADILENLANPDLTVAEVALRQRVTPRYIHRLFESEGVTFSEFVCEARLRRAHSMLLNPRFCDRSIMTIAFATGFGDLSYFNRRFRRRFGAAPTEFRCDKCRIRKNCDQAKNDAALRV